MDKLYSFNENHPKFLKMIVVTFLTWHRKNHFSRLTRNIIDGAALESLLALAIANIFICAFENELRGFCNDFKRVF